MSSVDTPDNYTIVAHFSRVFAPVASELAPPSGFGLTVDPVALPKMGEAGYNITPVGAGPFEVVSDKPSADLMLKRNPGFWKKGFPRLDSIHFAPIGTDESAYEALEAGQAQVYEGLQTVSLVGRAEHSKQLGVYALPANAPYVIQLNTSKAPFNNILAREALYYATDAAAIDKHLFNNRYPLTETPTGPGGLCYGPDVPGYRTYNLAKAKSIVKQLGGLNTQSGTMNLLPENETRNSMPCSMPPPRLPTTPLA